MENHVMHFIVFVTLCRASFVIIIDKATEQIYRREKINNRK